MNNINVVCSFWMGSLSNLEITSIKSFIYNGFDVVLYTYEPEALKNSINLKNLIIKDASCVISNALYEKVFDKSTIKGRYTQPSWFADMFRYKMLYDNGGVWFDLDIICVRPFSVDKTMLVMQKDDDCSINNNFICVEKGDKLIKCALDKCMENFKNDTKRSHGSLGPSLLSSLLKLPQFSWYKQFVLPSLAFNEIDWREIKSITEPNMHMDLLLDENVLGIHLWNKVWSSDLKLSKDTFDYPNSLIKHLYTKYNA